MKKRFVTLILAGVFFCITLTACGEKKNANSNQTVNSTESESSELTDNENDYTLSQAFSPEGEKIWYYVDNIYLGKEARVCFVCTFEDDKFYFYDVTDSLTLGTLSKMSDDEIIKKLHDEYENVHTSNALEILDSKLARLRLAKENMDRFIAGGYTQDSVLPDPFWGECTLDKSLQGNENYSPDIVSDVNKVLPLISEKLDSWFENDIPELECKEPNFELQIFTDASGNKVSYMQLYIYNVNKPRFRTGNLYEKLVGFEEYIEDGEIQENHVVGFYASMYYDFKDSLDVEKAFNTPDNLIYYDEDNFPKRWELHDSLYDSIQVYDSYYSGYFFDNHEGALVCRCDNGTVFTFDEIGTEGVVVDPEPLQTYFDDCEATEEAPTDTY